TQERLHLVPSQRVADERQLLPLNNVQKPLGLEPRQIAPVRFPSPVKKARMLPVLHAVLKIRYGRARHVGIKRPSRFCHPLPPRHLTFILHCTHKNYLSANLSVAALDSGEGFCGELSAVGAKSAASRGPSLMASLVVTVKVLDEYKMDRRKSAERRSRSSKKEPIFFCSTFHSVANCSNLGFSNSIDKT
ncbi:hypothetical protein ACMD2_00082, partial [Ananas comosus]